MKVRIQLILMAVAGIVFSCTNPQKGANSPQARTELNQLAEKDIYVGNKYLRMAEKIALLLEESAGMSDQAAITHIRDFASDNAYALEEISGEFDAWQKGIDDEEMMFFVMKLRTKEFSTKLRYLVPAFRSRIKDNKEFLAEYDALVSKLEVFR